MHYLYFVAKKKEKGDIKEEVQSEVRNELESEGFAGESGFYNNSKADWFVMGGRWSGELSEIKIKDWHKKATELVKKNRSKEDKKLQFITNKDIENNKEELQKLWESLGGTGKNTWDRDQYYGTYEDDVMLLNKELIEVLDSKEYKEVEVAIMEDGYIQDEMLFKDFLKIEDIVDNYWLCVVDYHN